MKIDRLIWGILFVFIGGVLLLDNFNIIEFYWRNIWQFWPIFLIIAGVNLLVGKKDSNLGGILSIGILVVALAFLFWKGQQPPSERWFTDNMNTKFSFDNDGNSDWDKDDSNHKRMAYVEPMPAAGISKAQLSFYGGGSSIEIHESTDSLMEAEVKQRYGNLSYEKVITDSNAVLTFRNRDKKGKDNSWSVSNSGNDMKIRLNTAPEWTMDMKMGAGSMNLDLSSYKVRSFNFDGGASALDVKLGKLLPITDVRVKAGVADVKLNVPQSSGCQITAKMGLSVKDFEGFTKIRDGVYQTANFATATNKIFVKFDGGLASFEVQRY